MRQFFFPTKDATIYEEYPNKQAGLDEILEVGKTSDGLYSMRSLIQFNIDSISASIADNSIPDEAEFDIKLFIANADRIITDQIVALYPVSQSWVEGQGYYYQDSLNETKGATWKYKDTGSCWASSGSSYISTTELSASMTDPITDLTYSATSLVRSWISGTVPNYGVLSKFSTYDESDISNSGNIKFFSRNTHTIYSPILIAKWDDSSRSTGSLLLVSSSGITVYPSSLRHSYKSGEVVRVDIIARAQYPQKTFASQFSEWDTSYLPSSSYYSIVDSQNGDVIIPFDNYSKISVDSTGNFIKFRIERMFPRRYYSIRFKVIIGGYEYIFDDRYNFVVDVS